MSDIGQGVGTVVDLKAEVEDYVYLMTHKEKDDDYKSRALMNTIFALREFTDEQAKVIAHIFSLFFKGKYYSNSYNFRLVVRKHGIDGNKYNSIIWGLEKLGILKEVKEKVYELTEGLYIMTRKEMEESNPKEYGI